MIQLVVRKEVIVKEDGRVVILYTFLRAPRTDQPTQESQSK
jgi:hypothetical protein